MFLFHIFWILETKNFSQGEKLYGVQKKLMQSMQFMISIDRPIDWLLDWLLDLILDWLIDWLISRLIDWLLDWFIGRLIDWLIDWVPDCTREWSRHSAVHCVVSKGVRLHFETYHIDCCTCAYWNRWFKVLYFALYWCIMFLLEFSFWCKFYFGWKHFSCKSKRWKMLKNVEKCWNING